MKTGDRVMWKSRGRRVCENKNRDNYCGDSGKS